MALGMSFTTDSGLRAPDTLTFMLLTWIGEPPPPPAAWYHFFAEAVMESGEFECSGFHFSKSEYRLPFRVPARNDQTPPTDLSDGFPLDAEYRYGPAIRAAIGPRPPRAPVA